MNKKIKTGIISLVLMIIAISTFSNVNARIATPIKSDVISINPTDDSDEKSCEELQNELQDLLQFIVYLKQIHADFNQIMMLEMYYQSLYYEY